MEQTTSNGTHQNMFEVAKRGGYEPTQVDSYIQKLVAQKENLKKDLEIAMNVSNVQEPEARLYDPDGAARKVLAAAQMAADNMIIDAKNEAKAEVAAYHEKHREEIEAQTALYEKEKEDLSNKISVIKNLKDEIQKEIEGLVSGARSKMEAVHLATRELEEIVNNVEHIESAVSGMPDAKPPTSFENYSPVPEPFPRAAEVPAPMEPIEEHPARAHLEAHLEDHLKEGHPEEQLQNVAQEVMSTGAIFEGGGTDSEPTQILDPLVASPRVEQDSFFKLRSGKRR